MQVAVAVAGIEGLDRNGDQKVALALMANSLAARRVADAVGLMQRVRNVVGQRALLEHPLVVGGEKVGQREQQKKRQDFLSSLRFDECTAQNFTDTDKSAPKAPAVTIATGPCAAAMP